MIITDHIKQIHRDDLERVLTKLEQGENATIDAHVLCASIMARTCRAAGLSSDDANREIERLRDDIDCWELDEE